MPAAARTTVTADAGREQGGQRGGLVLAELPVIPGRGGGGFGALGVDELRAACRRRW